MDLPQKTRVYENHHLDSPRWDRFETRPDDILITTAYKSGTTWMQTIVANLVFQDTPIPASVADISPWVDMRIRDFDEICSTVAAQQHRRFLKTHLALDGFPYKENMQYIYVGRDLRDVFMSLLNHYSNYSDFFYEAINSPAVLHGEPIPVFGGSVKEMWHNWTNRGWFDWETEGYPFWSSAHHAQSWWDYRHLPNMLFVHYADLLAEPALEIKRIADFLGIEVDDEKLPAIVEAVSFKTMRANSDDILGGAAAVWNGGSKTFINKGTNGRWREVLDEEDLQDYATMKANNLTPECAAWLEQGRTALSGAAVP